MNQSDNGKETPLHLAAYFARMRALATLLVNGAGPSLSACNVRVDTTPPRSANLGTVSHVRTSAFCFQSSHRNAT